jgi:nucleoside 2-deoxyribosyltransferase
MMKVYLAGPISGLSFDACVDWRVEWIDFLASHDIEGLSPLRGKHRLAGQPDLSDEVLTSRIPDLYSHTLSTDKGIITRDFFDCRRADLILFNLLCAEQASIGTCMEAAIGFEHRKPMVFIMEKTGNPHDHPMMRECMSYRVANHLEAEEVVLSVLKSNTPHRCEAY